MKQSTSITNINADQKLSRWQMKAYRVFNIINNSFPNLFIDKNIFIKKFSVDNLDKYWPIIDHLSSPSRALSDLFWTTLPWLEIKKQLTKINLLDIGCGPGRYLEKFKSWSNNSINTYTGLDININKNWDIITAKHPYAKFITSNSAQINENILSSHNIIVSQSAIEHFQKDLLFFRSIKESIEKHPKPTIQIHLFPSKECLSLYKYHGFRQYTPRTISKITKLFNKHSTITLYSLGGYHCNNTHNKFITSPKYKDHTTDQRNLHPQEYSDQLKKSIEQDFKEKNNHTSFYALIIKSFTNG